MDIQYELKDKEVASVQSEVVKRSLASSPALRRLKNIWFVLSGIVLAAFLIGYLLDRISLFFLGVGLLAVVLLMGYAFALPALLRRGIRKALVKAYSEGPNRIVGKHRFSMNSQAVSDAGDNGEMSDVWADIVYVNVIEKHLFIEGPSGRAYLIPQTAFTDEEAFGLFCRQAMDYHRTAGAVSAD